MKLRNRQIGVTGSLLCIMLAMNAQNELRAQDSQAFHRNSIGITLTQLPFADIRISYEHRFLPSHALIVSGGYKIAYRSFTDATQIDLGQNPTAWCYRNTASWQYLSAGYRYYFNKSKTAYLSPELFYKQMQADRVVYTFGVGDSGGSTLKNQYDIRSMKARMVGLNLLIGKKLIMISDEKLKMGVEIYTGLTLRYKVVNTIIYGSETISRGHDENVDLVTLPLSENPEHLNEYLFQVSGQAGLILFFSWQ
jgi:hypothetical protein